MGARGVADDCGDILYSVRVRVLAITGRCVVLSLHSACAQDHPCLGGVFQIPPKQGHM